MGDFFTAHDWCQSCGGSNVIEIDHEWLEAISYCLDCGNESDDSGSPIIGVFDRNQIRRIRSKSKYRRRDKGHEWN